MKQHNDVGTKEDLALYRIEMARSDINSAKILLDAKEYRGANNRAYYAIYHAISGETRHASDYDDFYIATKDEAQEQIITAEEMLEQVERYIGLVS